MARRRSEGKVVFELACAEDAPRCNVALEPLGSVHELRSGDAFQIEVEGRDPQVEITFLADGLIIAEWSGAHFRLRDESGRELVSGS